MYTPRARARVYRAQTRFLSLSFGRARREPAELNESSRIDGSGPRGARRVSKTDVDDREANEPWPTSVATSPRSSGVATGTLKILMNHPFSRLLQ